MTAEKDLHTLLATMHPVLREGEYVYALWPHGKPLAGAIAAAVREAEGLTVVLPRAEADSLGLLLRLRRRPGSRSRCIPRWRRWA